MITALTLANVATYPAAGVSMENMVACNFVYGPNGSGKTTMSRYLADQQGPSFGSCSVTWAGNRPLSMRVYNADYLQGVFGEDSKVKGVFTLGKEDKSIKERIGKLSDDLAQERRTEQQLTITLQGADGKGGKEAGMAKAIKDLGDACLEQIRKYKSEFKGALKGVVGDREDFRKRLLKERMNNPGATCTLEDLQTRARTVFTANPITVSLLPTTDLTRLRALEGDPIFKKPIVGKADVNIAALIAHLQNSDWVSQGLRFFEKSKPDCPFCQQRVPASLEKDLADFFDTSFVTDKNSLKAVIDDYKVVVDKIDIAMKSLRETKTDYHDSESLGRLIDVFDARLASALITAERKSESPSMVADLSGVVASLNDINAFVVAANAKIAEHNHRVANSDNEKNQLTNDFWRHVIDVELKSDLDTWDKESKSLERAIESLKLQIKSSKDKQAELTKELNGLEEKTSSIQPTVEKINQTLKAFHFNNFRLEPEDALNYRLVRVNGDAAYRSLSEGEKTFITFLYFYHLSHAADSATGIDEDRVVVLDDPISSLDSDILFVVSSLVREMAESARDGKGPIKQILVLTHNVYFHKEITFPKGGGLQKSAFWVCRKKNDTTELIAYKDKNPVKSSYQLLWQDIRNPEGHGLTLPNTMRRIFDTYFKLLGNVDMDGACEGLSGDERLAARALLSWVNDASHSVHDDLYMVPDENAGALYLKVFRRIFYNLRQGEHYRMMMDTDFKPEDEEKLAA